jgi:hypothetical protein
MADPDSKTKPNAFEQMFPGPLVQPPEGEDGMGSTVGGDVSVGREREQDARHGAHGEDVIDIEEN